MPSTSSQAAKSRAEQQTLCSMFDSLVSSAADHLLRVLASASCYSPSAGKAIPGLNLGVLHDQFTSVAGTTMKSRTCLLRVLATVDRVTTEATQDWLL